MPHHTTVNSLGGRQTDRQADKQTDTYIHAHAHADKTHIHTKKFCHNIEF